MPATPTRARSTVDPHGRGAVRQPLHAWLVFHDLLVTHTPLRGVLALSPPGRLKGAGGMDLYLAESDGVAAVNAFVDVGVVLLDLEVAGHMLYILAISSVSANRPPSQLSSSAVFGRQAGQRGQRGSGGCLRRWWSGALAWVCGDGAGGGEFVGDGGELAVGE